MEKKVLVVDDELEILAAIRAILEEEGYEVEVCPDGQHALDLLGRGNMPDLVITDVMMPRLSGYELVRAMRRDRSLRHIPVVLMSGVNPSISRPRGRWNEFIKKPFSLEDLIDTVGRWTR